MLAKYFSFDENNTDLKTEFLAGVTIFLATIYIVIVNPIILSQAGLSFNGVVTATVLITAISTILMGVYGKNPIVVAPGMGLNAYFTFSVVKGMGVSPEIALGTIFWSGIIFVILSVTNIRSLIVDAIPKQIRYAISCGIGLFIALIGLSNAGFIVSNPATMISQGMLTCWTITFLIGLMVTSILLIRKTPAALLIGIIITTIIAFPIGRYWGDASSFNHNVATLVTWHGFVAMPDFSLILKLKIIEALKFIYIPVIFSFLFTDMFDSLSTFVGVAEAGNLIDQDGNPRNLKKSLLVDAISTLISGLLGSSSGTSYIESAAGINAGGRTGFVAVVTGVLFIPLLFFSPIISMIPAIATAPVLVLVGVFMMNPITRINWKNLDDAIPSFLAMFLIPLSYSITNGIVWGIISYILIKFFTGKKSEIRPSLLVIGVFCLISQYYSHFITA